MRITCIGGGPAGLYFALLMKLQDARHEVTVIERNARPTPSAGAWCSPTRRWRAPARRRQDRRPDPRRLQPLGRHRRPLPGSHAALHRPRLLRHRPHAPAQHPAGALRRARRRHPLQDRVPRRRRRRRRPDHRLRRPEQPLPQQVRHLPARHRSAPLPLRLAGHEEAVRRLHLRLREDRVGWFQAHAYRFDETTSTFIVETPDEVWRAAGLEDERRRASPSASAVRQPSTAMR